MMPRHTYSAWLGVIGGALLFALIAMFEFLNSLSPPSFSDELLFNWSVSPTKAVGEVAICLVTAFLFPIWVSAVDDQRFRSMILMAVTAGMTGLTLAGCVFLVISVCVKSHFSACLTWVLAFGLNTFVFVRTANRLRR